MTTAFKAKRCVVCGEPFRPASGKQNACSNWCRDTRRRQVMRDLNRGLRTPPARSPEQQEKHRSLRAHTAGEREE
jgi:hypothetical protein